MAVTGAAVTACLKRRLHNVLPNVTYSPSHRQAGTPVINTQSKLRTAPALCENVSLAVLFGSNCNSYTIYTIRYVYVYTCHNKGKLVGQNKFTKLGHQ
jgi:hypothetical protein